MPATILLDYLILDLIDKIVPLSCYCAAMSNLLLSTSHKCEVSD